MQSPYRNLHPDFEIPGRKPIGPVAQVPDESAIGRWLFNGAGATAYDLSGNNNNGALSFSTIKDHHPDLGECVFLDANEDAVNYGDIDSVQITELTVSIAVVLNSGNSDRALLTKTGAWSGSAPLLFWQDLLGTISGRSDTYSVLIDDGTNTVRIEGATNAVKYNKKQRITFTFTPNSATGLRLYIGGVEDAYSPVSTVGVSGIRATTDALKTGAFKPLNGWVGDLVIERRVWSAEEIANHSADPYSDLISTLPDIRPSVSGGGLATYTHTAAGGAQSGGSADISFTAAYVASGGAISGGAADQSVSINYVAAGGLQSSGAADLAVTKSVVGVGGATAGGSAALSNILAITGVGGAISGGGADVLFTGVNSYSYTATGGVQSGGEAAISVTINHIAVGGLQSSGAADLAITKSIVADGGAITGGSASVSNILAITGAGGAISGGGAVISFNGVTSYSHIASGGLLAAGAAQVSMTTVVQVSGGGQSSGAADVSITKAVTGSGGALSGGAANINYTVHIVGAGGGVSGGAADVTTNAITNYSHIAMGGLQSGGAALFDFATTTFPVIAKISFTLKGRTTVFTLKSRKTKLTLH